MVCTIVCMYDPISSGDSGLCGGPEAKESSRSGCKSSCVQSLNTACQTSIKR